MFNGIEAFLIFAFVISVVVFIHELGHYSIACLFRVRVQEFSIGFGKALYSWYNRAGTQWKIGWIPLGGYVKMLGDADPTSFPDDKRLAQLTPEEEKEAFYLKPLWQKALIVFAGPAANYLLALVILTMVLFLYGQVMLSNEVGSVVPGSPAEQAGMQVGDIIYEIDGNTIESLNDIKMVLAGNTGGKIELGIQRHDQKLKLSLTPEMKEFQDRSGNKVKMAVIGITAKAQARVQYTIWEAANIAVKQAYQMSALILKSIPQFFTGQRSTEELGGPLTIADYSHQSFQSDGIVGLFLFIAMLSLNLGLINLLPIPMLDGGHLLFYVVEAIRGRPLATSVMEYSSRVGLILLLGLMLFVIGNDIVKYVFS